MSSEQGRSEVREFGHVTGGRAFQEEQKSCGARVLRKNGDKEKAVRLRKVRKGKNMRLRRLAEARFCVVLWAIEKNLFMVENNGSH